MTHNDNSPLAANKKDTDLSIGERIQKKRKELNLSAEELVLLISYCDQQVTNNGEKGISLPTIYRYEKGEREPANREIKLLCKALNVSSDWLIFGQLWNSLQELDSALANNLRELVKQALPNTIDLIMSSNKSRDDLHQLMLSEVKNRSK